jgi:hypothetical protein
MLGRIIGLILMRGPTLMLGPVRMLILLYWANASGASSVKNTPVAAIDRSNRMPPFIGLEDRLPWPVSIISRPRKFVTAPLWRAGGILSSLIATPHQPIVRHPAAPN